METLKVVWKDLDSRQRFCIGELRREVDSYTFQYRAEDVAKAQKKGFKGLVAFPNFDEVYREDKMFSVFESRLPDRRRSDIEDILHRYGLKEFDAFELLKKTEGRQPIDTLEFILPIDLTEKETVKNFWVAGVRHYESCTGREHEECTKKLEFPEGAPLVLEAEPHNDFDTCAVVVKYHTDEGYIKVGYMPMYYAREVSTALTQKDLFDVTCEVLSFDVKRNCQECLKARLTIKRKMQ